MVRSGKSEVKIRCDEEGRVMNKKAKKSVESMVPMWKKSPT